MAAPMEDDDLLETDNYYAWLGVHKSASQEEINNAFRKMSRIYHPDKHVGNEEAVQNAEMLFNKIKKAHDVLTDPHQKAVYDTMGIKGLETDGWEIVTRTKTPQEILEEYERLQAEKEERKLQQKTNPRGNVSVGIDATDIFDRYQISDAFEYSIFPHVEISQMSISQSVDCPLTTSDTAVIAGSLSTDHGQGSGNITTTYRRVMSHKSWAEGDVSIGNNTCAFSMRGFRTLWKRAFGTMSGTCQLTSRGIKPVYTAMLAQQIDKHFQVRSTYTLGFRHSSLQTILVWDNENNHVAFAIQLGIPSSFAVLNYTHNIPDYDVKLRARLKVGTLSVVGEYGCEKKITQFSTLGATMIIGVPNGIILNVKLNRGNQTYNFPIHLSEDVKVEPILYGTIIPIAVVAVVKAFIINPFIKDQKGKELQKKREANVKRKQEKQKEAKAAVELMKETIDRSIEVESRKDGLIIKKAVYGNLTGESLNTEECINITQPLQAMVKDSKLILPEGTQLSELPGFYDPCVGEDKQIHVIYTFRKKQHIHTFNESSKILLPNREHLCDEETDATDET